MAGESVGRAVAVVGRVVGWGVLGGVCGLTLSFTNGVIHVPPEVPGEPLANEWYPVGVLAIMFVEAVAGFLVGAGIAVGVHTPSGRRWALAYALGGTLTGLCLGGVLSVLHVILIDWRDGSDLVSNLIAQAAGCIVGLVLAASRRAAGVPSSKPRA